MLYLSIFLLLLARQTIQQTLLASVLTAWQEGQQHHNEEPPDREWVLQEYDFIIVGAGTAGCTLANRLTENPNWMVNIVFHYYLDNTKSTGTDK